MPANPENSAVATGLEKFAFQSQRKATTKNANYRTNTLTSHTSKVMLKTPQARLQQYVNCELSDVQARLRKGRGNKRSNCQYLLDHRKSKRVPEKHLLLHY